MTIKLILTIDDAVVHAAKEYARKKGESLSGLVENYLKAITTQENQNETLSPKVTKLMGAVALPPDFNYKKTISNALVKKHS